MTLLIAPAIVFLAYSALLWRLVRSGAFWRVPCFCACLTVWLAYLCVWGWAVAHHPGLGGIPYVEPALIGVRLLAWLEAFAMATERLAPIERRLMLSLLSAVALIAAVITWGSQPDLYRAVRNYANLALATGSIVAVGCFWIAPIKLAPTVRNHCLILAVYFVNMAVAGLVPAKTVTAWRVANTTYFTVSLACCVAWWKSGVRANLLQDGLHVR